MQTTDAQRPQWLDEVEMAAWRNFIEAVEPLLADIDADLLNDHGLTRGDYEVFVHLSEAPAQAMRMCDLADRLRLSPSGLTRRLDGLVRLGYITRVPAAHDRRVTMAMITDHGQELLERIAPEHVATVRRVFIDHLNEAQMRAIADAFAAVRIGRASSRDAAA